MSDKERRTIREFFSGKKTKMGAILCILAGGMKAGSMWYYMLDKFSDGMFYMGFGLGMLGIWGRIAAIFYPIPKGKPDLNRPHIGARRVS